MALSRIMKVVMVNIPIKNMDLPLVLVLAVVSSI